MADYARVEELFGAGILHKIQDAPKVSWFHIQFDQEKLYPGDTLKCQVLLHAGQPVQLTNLFFRVFGRVESHFPSGLPFVGPTNVEEPLVDTFRDLEYNMRFNMLQCNEDVVSRVVPLAEGASAIPVGEYIWEFEYALPMRTQPLQEEMEKGNPLGYTRLRGFGEAGCTPLPPSCITPFRGNGVIYSVQILVLDLDSCPCPRMSVERDFCILQTPRPPTPEETGPLARELSVRFMGSGEVTLQAMLSKGLFHPTEPIEIRYCVFNASQQPVEAVRCCLERMVYRRSRTGTIKALVADSAWTRMRLCRVSQTVLVPPASHAEGAVTLSLPELVPYLLPGNDACVPDWMSPEKGLGALTGHDPSTPAHPYDASPQQRRADVKADETDRKDLAKRQDASEAHDIVQDTKTIRTYAIPSLSPMQRLMFWPCAPSNDCSKPELSTFKTPGAVSDHLWVDWRIRFSVKIKNKVDPKLFLPLSFSQYLVSQGVEDGSPPLSLPSDSKDAWGAEATFHDAVARAGQM
ncbi:hypothetical protein KIPB_001809 [Kipferlia bialata]|uniref:Uncharacterized protein n=1 Tax=Kipferlia bialata TaxID=797122 RepID=A0A9K3CSK2_9EUKA|nr:hypothetical protein KIPB_001809 [Kipferlia bialata]|eukprot:g1809.t1